ncbi:AraC family transcriptional regulator [Paenibacillus tritici]|uniref:AraC family transcriptional regulator n=2 Tax=Paenibacillus tritici TaxID=1873425 RepID=A0ABX2DWY3_9BACL|nr:AraC family transcriptional regulator [Paenibacillus tritici]
MNEEYRERIGKVIAYIEDNSSQPLRLDELAEISHFSKYHFTRIFTAVAGMTPMVFVTRKRIEQALVLLTGTNQTILEIAGKCGFESVSALGVQFKRHYGCTPGSVRNSGQKHSNFATAFSNKQADKTPMADYNRTERRNPLLRRAWDSMVEIRHIPEVEVAYIRHIGSYLDTYSAWDKLKRWAAQQGLHPANQQFIGISLDDTEFVQESVCRYDACVTLPGGFEREAHRKEAEFKTLSGGLYAVYSYYDTVDRFVLAYDSMFSVWLPRSGYEADDRPCLEYCLNDPAQDPEGKCRVELYIPIKQEA